MFSISYWLWRNLALEHHFQNLLFVCSSHFILSVLFVSPSSSFFSNSVHSSYMNWFKFVCSSFILGWTLSLSLSGFYMLKFNLHWSTFFLFYLHSNYRFQVFSLFPCFVCISSGRLLLVKLMEPFFRSRMHCKQFLDIPISYICLLCRFLLFLSPYPPR